MHNYLDLSKHAIYNNYIAGILYCEPVIELHVDHMHDRVQKTLRLTQLVYSKLVYMIKWTYGTIKLLSARLYEDLEVQLLLE